MLTCYTPSLLKKKQKTNGVLIWSNNGFPAIYAISEMFQQQGTQMALFFCPYEDGFWVDIWDCQPQNTVYYLQMNQASHSGFIFQPCKDDSGNFLLSEYNFELEPLR